MYDQTELISSDIEAYLQAHERKDLLRLLTCGSVDDGKSTLIGRLLYDSKMVYEDQLAALEASSTNEGSEQPVDLALLTDGLKAEREQGITIDVAYRYFSTARRKFIIADTPGHEQYTRNMATGASTCQLAIVLIDARHGVIEQTKRHSFIANLLGIKNVVVAVNKMDLIDWDETKFVKICEDYGAFAKDLDVAEISYLPMSALLGDNVVERSENMSWFEGLPLMEYLETVEIVRSTANSGLRLPIQMVSRPDLNFRGFAGTISSGTIRPGDSILALPSGMSSTVERIVTFDGDLAEAGPGRAVTLTLADEIDISRGDLLVHPSNAPLRAHDIDANIVWLAPVELEVGRDYLLQSTGGVCNAAVSGIQHRIDVNTLAHEQANLLALNDVGLVTISADKELLFDLYTDNQDTGSFILIDRLSNATVAAGMITGAASGWDQKPDASLIRQVSEITDTERSIRFGQQPATVLITGLTAAGKSTIATALEREMFDRGKVSIRLDGENIRMGISRDLGFSSRERSENLRRVSEVARLLNNQGVMAIAALVAPKESVLAKARELLGEERYIEVFVDTPIEVCRDRDPAGLYAAADAGEIPQFPGVSAIYEKPTDADVRVDTSVQTIDECVAAIVAVLTERGFLRG
jgi:bifunctional enzyme CysN/CysC